MSRYRRQSSNLLSCFNPAAADAELEVVAPPPPPPRPPTQPSLTTTLYRTESGTTFALTWSRDNLFGRSLHIHVNHHPKPRFHLQIKPWNWTKRGSHPLPLSGEATAAVHWDLSRAKFGSGPAPTSGFYVAIVVNDTVAVLVGDRKVEQKQDHNKLRQSAMLLRREHVYGSRQMAYEAKTEFGHINIDCRLDDADPRLYVSIDGKRVLQIKHLKWKFRGSERIHVAGLPAIQVSWDVHSWLFHPENPDNSDGYALFIFKFHNQSSAHNQYWNQPQQYSSSCGLGFETRKMSKRVKMLKSAGGRRRNHSSAASSSSLSSASSGCSSVMEWESVEETELKDPAAFSLLVYAWKT